MRAAALLLGAAATAAAPAPSGRRVGWWWDAPADPEDPSVSALIEFCGKHTTIVSSVLMRCGPTTLNGTVRGELMPSCAKAIPALAELGVESELWLGETDSSDSALKLWDSPDATVTALTALGAAHPGIKGFNFDLEVHGASWCESGGRSCSEHYSHFLATVRKGLKAAGGGPYRITVDAACSAGAGWSGVISNCTELANGADVFMNMGALQPPPLPLCPPCPTPIPNINKGRWPPRCSSGTVGACFGQGHTTLTR